MLGFTEAPEGADVLLLPSQSFEDSPERPCGSNSQEVPKIPVSDVLPGHWAGSNWPPQALSFPLKLLLIGQVPSAVYPGRYGKAKGQTDINRHRASDPHSE